jgi:hypothetical protein
MYSYDPTSAQISGNVKSIGTNLITLDTSASNTPELYNGWVITIQSGPGKGQTRIITNYTSGRVATLNEDWIINPTITSIYRLNKKLLAIDEVNNGQNLIIPVDDAVSSYIPTGSIRFNPTGNDLEIGFNDNTWSTLGVTLVETMRGYITGCVLEYVNATNIKVTTGIIHVKDTIFTITSDTASFTPSKIKGVNYVYFDYSEGLISGAATYVASSTPPAWNDTYQGWYMFATGTTPDISEATSGTEHTLTTFKLDPSINATTDEFNNYYIEITSGDILGETRKIISHTTGINAVATLEGGFSLIPADSVTYKLYIETNGTYDRMVGFFYAHDDTINILDFQTYGNGSEISIKWQELPDASQGAFQTNTTFAVYDGTVGNNVGGFFKIPINATELSGVLITLPVGSVLQDGEIYFATDNLTTNDAQFSSSVTFIYNEANQVRIAIEFALNFEKGSDNRDTAFYYRTNTTSMQYRMQCRGFKIIR